MRKWFTAIAALAMICFFRPEAMANEEWIVTIDKSRCPRQTQLTGKEQLNFYKTNGALTDYVVLFVDKNGGYCSTCDLGIYFCGDKGDFVRFQMRDSGNAVIAHAPCKRYDIDREVLLRLALEAVNNGWLGH